MALVFCTVPITIIIVIPERRRIMKEKLTKIKNWFKETEHTDTWAEDVVDFSLDHPMTSGFLEGCFIVWLAMVISSWFHKGQKLDWVNKD